MTLPVRTNRFDRAYFRWLCELIGADTPGCRQMKFAWMLHQKEFRWSVPNDDNRAVDGQKLRDTFAEEMSMANSRSLDYPCTIFEMLVALAQRMDYTLWDSRQGSRTARWFWEMVTNLGLIQYTDDEVATDEMMYHNDTVLAKFEGRSYSPSGHGGLFPLRSPLKADQRVVEIWYQMMAYIEENYAI